MAHLVALLVLFGGCTAGASHAGPDALVPDTVVPDSGQSNEYTIGNATDLARMGRLATETLLGEPFQVSAQATIERLAFISRESGSHARMALYHDATSSPGGLAGLVASTLDHDVVVGPNEYTIVPSSYPATLEVGTYWIMLVVDASTEVAAAGYAGDPMAGEPTLMRYREGWSPWNQPFPVDGVVTVSDSLSPINVYMVVSAP